MMHTHKHKFKSIANIARARWTRLAKNDLLDKLEDMEDGSCSIFQGRTLYWHISNNTTFLSDIPDFQSENGGTIPSYLTITADRPDIVLIDKEKNTAKICELTVPFETNIQARHTYKSDKYAYLINDITTFKASLCAFEIGSRGSITNENIERLKEIYKFCDKTLKFKTFCLGKVPGTLCSYLAFL